MTGISAQLITAGHIVGTVTDADDTPIKNISAQAYCWQDDGTSNAWWKVCASATTSANGTYDIGGLAAGTYRVGFIDSQYPAALCAGVL